MKESRNYGIELLRLLLMFMVCILHTLGMGGILSASIGEPIKNSILWFIEIFAYCAVDGFAIISGYTAHNTPQKYEKLINIWFQVFFYSFIMTLLLIILGVDNQMSTIDLFKCALPIIFNKFWYMTAYFLLFFSIPIFNKFLFELNEKNAKKMLIILVILFSVIGIVTDSFNTNNGYSAIWLMVLYCIGVLAKQTKLFEQRKFITLVLLWILSILVTWGTKVFFGIDKLINYVSPTILLNGIIMVVLFSRLKFKGHIVSKLAPLTLGIYLFQLNPIIWNNIIKDSFAFVVSNNILITILYVLAFASVIFVCGMTIEWIRQKLTRLLRLHVLSQKIINISHIFLEKMFVFLK